MTDLTTVAFDIETTGFATDDRLTVVGFDSDIGSRLFLNTGGRRVNSPLEPLLNDRVSRRVRLSERKTEAALLQRVTSFVSSTLSQRQIKLVAYNGERWKGGFDLPFLRTRLSHHDISWPFQDLPYVDALDVFETQFNTTENTLEDVYEELIGGDLTDLDPFNESSESVNAWKDGDFESVLLHNLADIRRTRALMRLAERYCSKSDFSMKSLDPVVSDRQEEAPR